MKLTPHFALSEFVDDADIEKPIPGYVVSNLRTLCEKVLEPLRDAKGPIRINSGWRSPEHNKEVGGVPTSQHIVGQAADIELPQSQDYIDVAKWIDEHLLFDQVILEAHDRSIPGSGWIHVSYANATVNRHWVLHSPRNPKTGKVMTKKGKVVYLPGLPA